MTSMRTPELLLYINLDARADRRESIVQQIGAYVKATGDSDNLRVRRLSATPGGYVGCVRSHQRAVAHLLKESHLLHSTDTSAVALVLEDDFMWTEPVDVAAHKISAFLKNPPSSEWGLVQICHSPGSFHEHVPVEGRSELVRVMRAGNAGGYLVSHAGAEKLLPLWGAAAAALEKGGAWGEHANDVVWDRIRQELPCYAFVPRLGKQKANRSDLENREVDYG